MSETNERAELERIVNTAIGMLMELWSKSEGDKKRAIHNAMEDLRHVEERFCELLERLPSA